MSDTELKPCPFCGYDLPYDEGIIEVIHDEDDIILYPSGVCCAGCGAYAVGGEDATDAVKSWNTRTNAKEELIDKVKEVVEPCCEAAVIKVIKELDI